MCFPAFAFLLQLTARPGGSSPSPSASSLCCVSRLAGFQQPDMTWHNNLCRVSFCLCSQGLFFLFDLRASDTCTNFEKGGGTCTHRGVAVFYLVAVGPTAGNPCRARDTPLPDKHTHGRGGCLLYFHENRNYPCITTTDLINPNQPTLQYSNAKPEGPFNSRLGIKRTYYPTTLDPIAP